METTTDDGLTFARLTVDDKRYAYNSGDPNTPRWPFSGKWGCTIGIEFFDKKTAKHDRDEEINKQVVEGYPGYDEQWCGINIPHNASAEKVACALERLAKAIRDRELTPDTKGKWSYEVHEKAEFFSTCRFATVIEDY